MTFFSPRIMLIMGIWVVCIGITKSPVMAIQVDPKVKNEIQAVLNDFYRAYEQKDINKITSLISPESDTIFFDSGDDPYPGGRFQGLDQIKQLYGRDFEQFKSAEIKQDNVIIGSRGDIAWFAAEYTANVDLGDEKIKMPARWTGVLEKKDNKWLLIQSHVSFPPTD